MNRKQRRSMYKKYPVLKKVVKEQSTKASQELETAFKKKWQNFSEIQSEKIIQWKNLGDQFKLIKDQKRN